MKALRTALALLVALYCLPAAWAQTPRAPDQASLNYHLQPRKIATDTWVLEGAVADFALANGCNIINTAFIATGDGVVVINTGPSRRYGEQQRRAIASVTQEPVRQVLNLNLHPDYFFGNQAWADIPTQALAGSIAGMQAEGESYADNLYRLCGPWLQATQPTPARQAVQPQRFTLGRHDLELRRLRGHTGDDLVLLDHSEYALYSIHHELDALKTKGLHACELVPILANVRDEAHLISICEQHKPHTIYHAAAYKHVPMVELNPGEGVLNNVFGTLNMVKAAITAGVQDFVLISTDKAVRPTNVMGATKRVAEMILQAVAASNTNPFAPSIDAVEAPWQSPTRFSMVRFGNVLGSSGSVIPLFRRQIAAGGPITVTHPEVTRYFMTIPEAAQLVLQAGAMAEGGDVFVLDMGTPVRILEIARRMVTLSGLSVRDQSHPDADIDLVFTGLRPGEKLYEELLIGENAKPTEHRQILRAREEYLHWRELQHQLQGLMDTTRSSSLPSVKALLNHLVSGGKLEYR